MSRDLPTASRAFRLAGKFDGVVRLPDRRLIVPALVVGPLRQYGDRRRETSRTSLHTPRCRIE